MTSRRPPAGLLIPAAGALALILIPLAGLLQHVRWGSLLAQLTSSDVRTALRLSIECSFLAVAVSLILGVPLAWMLARSSFPGKAIVRAIVTLPMVLPPVVGGVALLLAFGAHGFAGEALSHIGITLPFTTAGTVVAETFVAMPFLVIAVEAGLRQADARFEEVAATLGARPWMRFWRVTLPIIAPSLVAGSALTWARALGEFGATITFAGNLPGTTQTMPLAVYVALESDTDGAIALSLLMLVVSLAVLIGLRHRWLGATA
ncbi:MAG TPA: ABC transporter permease [Candidatus Dormibacteraeota bacterium]|jgi:molybdate transport system permease protein